METADKMDVCDNMLRVCRIVGADLSRGDDFCASTYCKGAIDAIHEFQFIVTPGGKYVNAVDEMERKTK